MDPATLADAASPRATPTPDDTPRRLIAKISRRLLGFLFVLFFFSFLDRINIGFAGLTMTKDLGLSATQFGLATTLFYIAYIACGVPGNVVLTRIGARRWIGAMMIAWGIASSATMFATSAGTLYALRVLVGITEAGFLPGILLYLTHWFPAAYRARANALFMIAMPVTAALGSAVSGYLLALDGTLGLRGWQWLFVLEGLPAALLGFVTLARLDDRPADARWLTDDEKRTLAQLLAADHAPSAGQPVAHTTTLWRELTSAPVLLMSLMYFCLVNSLAMVAVWTPLIVKSFDAHASNRTVGLLAAIPQVCTIVAMIVWGRRSDRRQERQWHFVIPMLFAALGWLATAWAPFPAWRLLGVCAASAGAYTAMSIFWTTPDLVLSASARAIGIAAINAIGNIGSALNPLAVGWLKDVTHSFAAGLLYAAALLAFGALVATTWPAARRAAPHSHPHPHPLSSQE
ncbi:MFS transporter [Burkholderia sp. PU8-34]